MSEEDMFRALEVRTKELEKQLGKMIYWARMAKPTEPIQALWRKELREARMALNEVPS